METGVMKEKAEVEAMEPWDNGDLGTSEHARRVAPEIEKEIMTGLGLQPISLRLPQQLIKDLKFIADYRAIGYQPLMRDVLMRWARCEMSQIAHELKEQVEAKATIEAAGLDPPKRRVAAGV